MTIEAELMAAIVTAPADDEPRLVYADHLMQRGDLLGELITLQCRIARADDADEPVDDGVLARERVLREVHGDGWMRPLAAIAESGYVFRRGFVEHVTAWTAHDVAAPRLLVIDEEEDPPPGEPRDQLAEMLEAAPLLSSVAVRGEIVDDGLITDAWKRVRSLTLFHVRTSPEFITPFLGRLDSLCRLQLTCCEATDDAARAWLSLPQPLEHLGFHIGWHVTAIPTCDVAALIADHQPGLRSLHLGSFAMTNPQALVALTKLERLAAHRLALTGRQLVDLVAALPALEVLEFDGDQLGELDLRALLAGAPKLRRLAIRRCRVDAAALAQATSLRRIDLEGCMLDDEQARTLLASEHLRSVGWWRIHQSEVLPRPTLEDLAARQTLRYEPPIPKYPGRVVAAMPSNKIQAIKEYRRMMPGLGLADAKMEVERMMEELGIGPRYHLNHAVPRWVRP